MKSYIARFRWATCFRSVANSQRSCHFRLMRRTVVILPALTLAAACQLGVPVNIEVRSGDSIQFTIPSEHTENFCLNAATIYREVSGRETVVWRIRLQPHSTGRCQTSFAFPTAPAQFVTEVSSTHLAPGSYRVEINGGLPQASGEFSVP